MYLSHKILVHALVPPRNYGNQEEVVLDLQ